MVSRVIPEKANLPQMNQGGIPAAEEEKRKGEKKEGRSQEKRK